MNKIKIGLVFMLFCLLFGLESKAEMQSDKKEKTGIKFEHTSWKEIIKKAKSENKLIFIDAYTTWCGPCKMMSKKIFTDIEVGEFFNQNFVNVKLDMEKELGLSLKSKLNVTAYPTLIFIDANENIEHKAVGSLPKAEFLKFGNEVLGGAMKLSDYNEAYKNDGIANFTFLVDYLKILKSAGEKVKLKQVVSSYFEDLESSKLLVKANWDLFEEYIHNTDNKGFQYLLENKNKFENLFGTKKVNEKIYYTCLRQGNKLCDKLESGKYKLNKARESKFKALLKKYKIKDRAKIRAYSNMNIASRLENWKRYANSVSKNLKLDLIDNGVMSLYNYALPIERVTEDKKIRAKAAKWCDMGLEIENLNPGFKNAFIKLKADLLEEK